MLLAVRRAGRGRCAAARSCRRSAPLSLCGLVLGAGRRPSGPCLPGRGPGPLPCQRPQLWAARARHLFPRTRVKVRRMPKRPGHLGGPGGAPAVHPEGQGANQAGFPRRRKNAGSGRSPSRHALFPPDSLLARPWLAGSQRTTPAQRCPAAGLAAFSPDGQVAADAGLG